jgi:26S proteasome regulatory subunit N7
MGSDPQYAKYPLLPLSQNIFTLTNPQAPQATQQSALKNLQDAIVEHKMAPLYKYLAHPTEGILNVAGQGSSSQTTKPPARKPSIQLVAKKDAVPKVSFPWDQGLYDGLSKDNEEELAKYKKEEEEAEEQAGETEIQAARGKRAEFYARIGDKVG